jgi:hypothetical protein
LKCALAEAKDFLSKKFSVRTKGEFPVKRVNCLSQRIRIIMVCTLNDVTSMDDLVVCLLRILTLLLDKSQVFTICLYASRSGIKAVRRSICKSICVAIILIEITTDCSGQQPKIALLESS